MSRWEVDGRWIGVEGVGGLRCKKKRKKVLTGRPSCAVAVIRGGDNEGDEVQIRRREIY